MSGFLCSTFYLFILHMHIWDMCVWSVMYVVLVMAKEQLVEICSQTQDKELTKVLINISKWTLVEGFPKSLSPHPLYRILLAGIPYPLS